MKAVPSESGFIARVLTAWLDLRASMRSLLASEPGEARILSFAMISGGLLFAGRALELLSGRAALPAQVPREAAFASAFLFQVMVWPLLLYGLAALITPLARAAGGVAGWRETRAAVAWAAMVQAPVDLVLTLPRVAADLPRAVGFVLSVATVSALLVALSYCVAEAHRFTRVWTVIAALGGAAAAVTLGVLSLFDR